jgi:hypothetical protein
MSRTVRVVIAGVVSAGILVVGAGAAFADSDDDGQDYGSSADNSSSSQDSGGGLGLGAVTGLVGSLTSGLGIGL